ncbi:MAG: ABC transporter permease [Cryomorphaceae bacterium]|nr:ABC transporter permease [Cryomorphaceae bacterium]
MQCSAYSNFRRGTTHTRKRHFRSYFGSAVAASYSTINQRFKSSSHRRCPYNRGLEFIRFFRCIRYWNWTARLPTLSVSLARLNTHMKGLPYKIAGLLLILFSLTYGLWSEVPELPIIEQSIRNLFYHVSMWFAMVVMMAVSFGNAIGFLSSENMARDRRSISLAETGMFFSVMGLLTGMLWAKFTWGAWWTNDPKLNGTAITMLIYMAYFVLRNTIDDPRKRARISAVYNIFAFVMMIVFIGILPRMTDSLHPGNGGNPGFNSYDLDNRLRLVFYPAVLGWILVGTWIASLRYRLRNLEE